MISDKYKKRFSVLLLDPNDVYTHKIQVLSNKGKQGLVHISALSIIIEIFNNELPLIQYYYQHMFKAPCQDPDFLETIIFSTYSKKYLPDMITEQVSRTENLESLEEISFKPSFESPHKIVEIISNYFNRAKSNNWNVKDNEILEFLRLKVKFDYTQIQSINEKNLIREALFVTRILAYERTPG